MPIRISWTLPKINLDLRYDSKLGEPRKKIDAKDSSSTEMIDGPVYFVVSFLAKRKETERVRRSVFAVSTFPRFAVGKMFSTIRVDSLFFNRNWKTF